MIISDVHVHVYELLVFAFVDQHSPLRNAIGDGFRFQMTV